MELQDVQNKEKKEIAMTIRITHSKRKWLRDNDISPSMLFNVALNELIKEYENGAH